MLDSMSLEKFQSSHKNTYHWCWHLWPEITEGQQIVYVANFHLFYINYKSLKLSSQATVLLSLKERTEQSIIMPCLLATSTGCFTT